MWSVREMTGADVETVTALGEACFNTNDRWPQADIAKAVELAHFFAVVAEEDDRIGGYCIVYAVLDSADIGQIAVAPEYRGNGVADLLLGRVWEICRDRGIADVILEVRAGNEAARCLYTKHGFETIALRKNYYREPTEHGLTMVKKLEAVSTGNACGKENIIEA